MSSRSERHARKRAQCKHDWEGRSEGDLIRLVCTKCQAIVDVEAIATILMDAS